LASVASGAELDSDVTLTSTRDGRVLGDRVVIIRAGPTSTVDPLLEGLPPTEFPVVLEEADRVRVYGYPVDIMEGATQPLYVALGSRPSAAVTLTLTSEDPGRLSLDPGVVTVEPASWNEAVSSVQATGGDYPGANGDATVVVTVTLSSADPEYAALGAAAISMRVISNERHVMLAPGTFNGNLGGIGGADTKCRDAGGTSYRALLVDGHYRVSTTLAGTTNGRYDWVLRPNTRYVDAAGQDVFSTDGNSFIEFPMTESLSPSAVLGWTGMADDFTAMADRHCGYWFSALPTSSGRTGQLVHVGTTAISTTSVDCDTARKLVCVE